jgi:hypothetical protein
VKKAGVRIVQLDDLREIHRTLLKRADVAADVTRERLGEPALRRHAGRGPISSTEHREAAERAAARLPEIVRYY